MKTLSEHLCCAAWVNVDVKHAAEALSKALGRFGPVKTGHVVGWETAKTHITPLRSFASRYLLLQQGDWGVLVNDRFGELGLVDAIAISREIGCVGVAAYFHSESRQFHVIEQGNVERSVVCYRDGGRWFFFQEGPVDAVEEATLYEKRQLRDRLPPELVCRYVERKTGVSCPPNWCELNSGAALERSTEKIEVEILDWETVDDL